MDKRAKAVAIKYEQSTSPIISAKGYSKEAIAIINKAKEFNIPIFQNEELVNMLLNMDINFEMDERIYKSLVDVFVWLHKTENSVQASN